MKNPSPERTVFFYLTDPETAAAIADRGFADVGIYNAQSTVTLLDQVPGDMGGGILRVTLPPDAARETLRREASDPAEGYRKFLVPLGLLKDAYLARVGA